MSSYNSNRPAGDDSSAGNHGQHDAGRNDAGHRGHEEAHAKGLKTAELFLPYVDPSDDMHHCLNDSETDLDALEALAMDMDEAADILRGVRDAIAGHEVSIETDSNVILVTGPVDLINDLIGKDLLIEEGWFDQFKEELHDQTVSDPPQLILCADGCRAPAVVTCVHVCDGTATTVVPWPHGRGGEVENDWFCKECFEKYVGDQADVKAPKKDLCLACLHCLREKLAKYSTPEF